MDTANSILIMQSIDTVVELMNNLLSTLQNRAIEEKDTLIIGRTHGVYAEETFLGNIFGNWYLEVSRSLKRIQNSKESIAFGKFSGPVGNHSVVTEEMEKLSLEKLGLVSETFAMKTGAWVGDGLLPERERIDSFADRIGRLRKTVGDSVDIMVDDHGSRTEEEVANKEKNKEDEEDGRRRRRRIEWSRAARERDHRRRPQAEDADARSTRPHTNC